MQSAEGYHEHGLPATRGCIYPLNKDAILNQSLTGPKRFDGCRLILSWLACVLSIFHARKSPEETLMIKKHWLLIAAAVMLAMAACSPASDSTTACPNPTTDTKFLMNKEHG